MSFAELPLAGVSFGSSGGNAKFQAAKERSLARQSARRKEAESVKRRSRQAEVQDLARAASGSRQAEVQDLARAASSSLSLHSLPMCQDTAHANSPALSRQAEVQDLAPAASSSAPASKTATKQIQNMLNLELCAGSAGYSAKLFKHGLSTLPIDASHNKHKQKLPCVTLDLSLP